MTARPIRPTCAFAMANNKFNSTASLRVLHSKVIKHFAGNAFLISDQAEQNMLCTDIGMIEVARFLLCINKNLLRPLRKSVH